MERVTLTLGVSGDPIERRTFEVFRSTNDDDSSKWRLRHSIWGCTYVQLARDRPTLNLGPIQFGLQVDAAIWGITAVQQRIIALDRRICQIDAQERELRQRQKVRFERIDATLKELGIPSLNSSEVTILTELPSYVRAKKRVQRKDGFISPDPCRASLAR